MYPERDRITASPTERLWFQLLNNLKNLCAGNCVCYPSQPVINSFGSLSYCGQSVWRIQILTKHTKILLSREFSNIFPCNSRLQSNPATLALVYDRSFLRNKETKKKKKNLLAIHPEMELEDCMIILFLIFNEL